MKHLRRLIAVMSWTILLLAPSCQKIEEVDDSATVLSAADSFIAVGSDATSAEFTITSNSDWTVKTGSDWIESYTQSGTGDGRISITFSANASRETERAASFSVCAGKKAISLTLAQARYGAETEAATLSATQLELSVDADATQAEFDIKSNTIWGVYTESDWLNEHTTMGEKDGKLILKFDAYKNRKVDRTAKILVSAREASLELTLTQLKTDKFEIVDLNTDKFAKAEIDEDIFYRIIGLVTEIKDAKAGSITIKDAFGTLSTTSLLDKEKGAADNFASLGVKIGDGISLIGYRGGSLSVPDLGEGFVEYVRPVTTVSISEFLAAPDGNDKWYEVSGLVTSITDSDKGNLVIKNPVGDEELAIEGVLTGVNGDPNKFSTLNVLKDDVLTVIVPAKSGSTARNVYYSKHKSGVYPKGVIAQWTFDAATMTSVESASTWGGGTVDVAYSIEGKVGDTGKYVLSNDKKSRMKYTQVDKTAIGIWSNLYMYNTGQPGFNCIWIGDAFEFDLATSMEVPAGTKIKASFCLRIPTAGLGCYMLEYYADGAWRVANDSANPVKKMTVSGVDYEYNIQRTGNNIQTLLEYTFITEYEIPQNELKVRIRAAAPYTSGGTVMTKPDGTARFRGVVSGVDLSPRFEVI